MATTEFVVARGCGRDFGTVGGQWVGGGSDGWAASIHRLSGNDENKLIPDPSELNGLSRRYKNDV